jgi:hypothetical protein
MSFAKSSSSMCLGACCERLTIRRWPCACNCGDARSAYGVVLRGVRGRRTNGIVGITLAKGWEVSIMPRTKQKHLKKAVPVAGVVGVSMALAGGSSATAAVGPTPDVPLWDTAPGPQATFIEEEIFDVSLGTFFVFDKETAGTPRLGVQFAQRGCRGCGGCRGCARGCRACRACGGCGGCSCGCCVSWGACRFVC